MTTKRTTPNSRFHDGVTLYYHKTDGGAEYLFDTFVCCPNGHKEGCINSDTTISVRLDGKPEVSIR